MSSCLSDYDRLHKKYKIKWNDIKAIATVMNTVSK
jgi:hypothetical protein